MKIFRQLPLIKLVLSLALGVILLLEWTLPLLLIFRLDANQNVCISHFFANLKIAPNCKFHIAFHGCLQTLANIGGLFHEYTGNAQGNVQLLILGYNEWAEANDIIVLYPQAMSNVLNPEGCWDWWGYSGLNFATKSGPQMATVQNLQQYIMQKYF